MALIKYAFFGYLALILLCVGGYLVSREVVSPRDPDTLYSTYNGSIRSLDPVLIADILSSDIAGHVYECLYNYRYGGKPDDIFPQLAAAMPEVSPDGLTWTIPLRKGVRFYDPLARITGWQKVPGASGSVGPEMTARDVIFSLMRLADARNAAPSYSTILQDNVVGLDDFFDYTSKLDTDKPVDYDRPIEGFKAPSSHTLVIRLTRPVPNLDQLLAYLGVAVVSRDAVEDLQRRGESMKESPIGTGPYAMTEYRPDQRIVLETNPVYRGWPDRDGGQQGPEEERIPRIKRIQRDYMRESLPAWFLFLQKRYDSTGIPKETFGQAITPDRKLRPEYAGKGIQLRITPDLGVFYFLFNVTPSGGPVGKYKSLRQAMSLAADRENYIRVYLNGRAIPAKGILPPDAPVYDERYQGPYARFDLAAAKAKVEEARREGYRDEPITLLMGDSDTEARQAAEFWCACFRAAGLNVVPEYSSFARYLERMDAKDYQVAFGGWVPDYPDDKTYLRLFDATLAEPPGSNTTGYKNPTYQALLEKSLVMKRSPERDALYRQCAAIIDEDLPAAAVYYPLRYSLRYNWVETSQTPVYFTQGPLAYVRLNLEMRKKAIQSSSN